RSTHLSESPVAERVPSVVSRLNSTGAQRSHAENSGLWQCVTIRALLWCHGKHASGNPVGACVIWVCFLLRALFYCSIVPLWEGYDEYSHFSWIQYFDANGSLPDGRRTNTSEEVQASLRLAPMPWMLRGLGQRLTHDAWWQLPATEREDRERQLRAIPPAW